MKVLIHNQRADAMDFLLGSIVNHGYKAGIATEGHEIINMLSNDQYSVVLTNGAYERLDTDQRSWLKSSSVIIIDITDQRKVDENSDLKVDVHLQRPFESSKLWQALAPAEKGFSAI